MAVLQSLQEEIDYREDHLQNEPSIKAIAKPENISLFHFQRMFLIVADITIGEYVRHRTSLWLRSTGI